MARVEEQRPGEVTVAVSVDVRYGASSVSIAVFGITVLTFVFHVKFASCALIVVQMGAVCGICVWPSWLGCGLVNHHCDMYSVYVSAPLSMIH